MTAFGLSSRVQLPVLVVAGVCLSVLGVGKNGGLANAQPEANSTTTPKLSLNAANVHWGYFSKNLTPVLTCPSGTTVVVEMATHHACDDWDRMIKGDVGMEDIYTWNSMNGANEAYRGSSGQGDGVHILTGPIYVEGAEPGDILKVEIIDLKPRLNAQGKTFGSNAAAWWGYHARVSKENGQPFYAGSFSKTPTQNDELVTIYEVLDDGTGQGYAVPAYQFEWPVITDPERLTCGRNFESLFFVVVETSHRPCCFATTTTHDHGDNKQMGVTRDYIAYPGTCVPHDPHGDYVPSSDVADLGWTKSDAISYRDAIFAAKIPINYHVGCMGLAPSSHDYVDSIPPLPTGGNLDNKRIGIGTTMYYPVEVAGGLISMGDAHAAQG
jgi:acetamidase/formamidase